MAEFGLPERLFETGYEPVGRKRVNNYFNLRWIEIVKEALDEEHIEMLTASQFGKLLKMGSHTFSVMFVHYILSRQVVTKKENELWWLFSGKPIRYSIKEFALVTGLNCGVPPLEKERCKEKGKTRSKGKMKQKATGEPTSIWTSLFGGDTKPTPSWIIYRLIQGKKYKDSLTRFRLALLVIVEGMLCPTCGVTNIRREVVSLLGDIEGFLRYPWGRESFILTVRSAKARKADKYMQDTVAIQGFAHAMVLVTVSCCPEIIVRSGTRDSICDPEQSSYDVVQSVVERKLTVNVSWAKKIDLKGHV